MVKSLVVKSRSLHRAKPLGQWQIVLLGLAVLAVSGAVYLYVQIELTEQRVTDARTQFQENRVRLNVLKQQVATIEANATIDLPTPTSIRTSLVKFEQDFLSPATVAQLAVIQEVNRLASQSNVIPSEISFDSIEQKALDGEAIGDRSAKSLYPGLDMSFTVEGSYANVRQFLIALERSRAFVIINALDLKSVEPSSSGGRARPNRGAATDQVIALGIKLSVYYQREAS
jgi:Tfp pilus assembly protein PilO